MVENKKYIPEQGDIILLDFDKNCIGHEQKGRRPGLVVSSKQMNTFTNICYICPITNNNNCYPFQIKISDKNKTTGNIMCEQMKSCDFVSRKIKFVEKINEFDLEETLEILRGFLL